TGARAWPVPKPPSGPPSTWVWTSTRRAAGTARSCSRVVTPSALRTARVVPAALSGSTPRSIGPLWTIARWNNPAAAGIPSRARPAGARRRGPQVESEAILALRVDEGAVGAGEELGQLLGHRAAADQGRLRAGVAHRGGVELTGPRLGWRRREEAPLPAGRRA